MSTILKNNYKYFFKYRNAINTFVTYDTQVRERSVDFNCVAFMSSLFARTFKIQNNLSIFLTKEIIDRKKLQCSSCRFNLELN